MATEKVTCECGGEYKPLGKRPHERGGRHRSWVEATTAPTPSDEKPPPELVAPSEAPPGPAPTPEPPAPVPAPVVVVAVNGVASTGAPLKDWQKLCPLYEKLDGANEADQNFVRDLELQRALPVRRTPQERAKLVRLVFHNYELDHNDDKPPFTVLDVHEAWGMNRDPGARSRVVVEQAVLASEKAERERDLAVAKAQATQIREARAAQEAR